MGVEWIHTSEERRREKLGWTVIIEPRECVSMFLFKQNVTSGNWRIKIRIPRQKLFGQVSVESSLVDGYQWSCTDITFCAIRRRPQIYSPSGYLVSKWSFLIFIV